MSAVKANQIATKFKSETTFVFEQSKLNGNVHCVPSEKSAQLPLI